MARVIGTLDESDLHTMRVHDATILAMTECNIQPVPMEVAVERIVNRRLFLAYLVEKYGITATMWDVDLSNGKIYEPDESELG